MLLKIGLIFWFLIPGAAAALFFAITLVRTFLFKNKENKIMIPEKDWNGYGEKLLELIKIKTTSFHDEEGYHEFRERLKVDYPLIHQYFTKEKIGDNAVFTSKKVIADAPNILFATHIDSKAPYREPEITGNRLYGTGTFDAKSLLFVMFEAVENLLKNEGEIRCNLTILMTTDDETTKEGSSLIVRQFLRRGRFFDLVLEEGSGIVGPEHIGLGSHHAFVGIGVTGDALIRFKSQTEINLKRFIEEIKHKSPYKTRIDKYSRQMILNIFRDTNFRYRYFFANLFIFRKTVKKIIEKRFPEIAHLLKTTVQFNRIEIGSDSGQCDLRFFLSTHDTTADALMALGDLMDKYKIAYEILDIKDASQFTSTQVKGYKIVAEVIRTVFQTLYITPVVLTKLSEKRYFDQVSDCVLRFSPLYYPEEVIRAKAEYIPVSSIAYGIKFFTELLNNYHSRKR